MIIIVQGAKIDQFVYVPSCLEFAIRQCEMNLITAPHEMACLIQIFKGHQMQIPRIHVCTPICSLIASRQICYDVQYMQHTNNGYMVAFTTTVVSPLRLSKVTNT